MALETSPESPAPVRTVSRLLGDWIGRLGGIWIEGQVAQISRRPGMRTLWITLRDTDADLSLSVVAETHVVDVVSPPLSEGQRSDFMRLLNLLVTQNNELSRAPSDAAR